MDLTMYSVSLFALVSMAALMLVQIVVNDVAGIKRRKIPGTMVEQSHRDFLFRASRTVANTNDVAVVFLMLVLANIFLTANPVYLAIATWSFVSARMTYSLCYYANWQSARSASFGIGLIALGALVITALWF